MNIPTVITFSRIVIILPFILVAPDHPLLGAVLFAVAALTDLLDGYIARKSKQVTKLGILLDPIADKLLVIAALIVLVDMEIVQAWIAIIIIAREFIVTGLRVVALTMDIIIPAEMGGKLKVTAQISSILVLFVDKSFMFADLYAIGITLLWIAMILGIVSGIQYFILFWKRV
ncbi:MAG TPA: CDP-diacylglycerol--glycerol-3-phosphate 3-phosphatidyltransferase [Nitrospirae bacterium]|nr:CDP-diacylglycerol--glycerol-3-phosphate 3-phosphatidyltransferase [Nitrospirota bacterium]HDZ02803.1 CDP-diacylglycerol--glycerol-3-phosphate 3-phosphatidyltransferase [Nitrospirota bacterium]